MVGKVYTLMSLLFLGLGVLIQLSFGTIKGLELFKLFNLFGLFFDVCGLLLLSEIAINAKGKFQVFMDAVYGSIMLLVFTVPVGIIFSSVVSLFTDLPSSQILASFAGGIMTYVAIPLFFIDGFGEIGKAPFYKTTRTRTLFMGWYLLLAGIVLQLIGATLDVLS
jgi:hypothetical protein